MQPSTTDRSTAKQALLEALLSDAGLKNLTQTASTVMGNPVLVVDPVYRYAARGGFELDDADDSPFAAITRAELSEGDMLQDEAVRYIIERDLDEKIARSTGPLIRYNDMFCLNTMTGAIKVHGTCLGRAMMIERNHAFGDSDREVFEFFVRLLAQELQKGGFLSLGGPQQGPYFLSRLLDDEIPNPITCTRKMQLVGFAPLPALYVVCLLKKDSQIEARDAESIRGQLQPLLHHSLITMYEGELVALVSRPPSTQLPLADEAILARVAAANNLFVGISNEFSQATDVRSHLNQARAAIRYGSTFTKILEDTHVYRYCEYTYMEMLDICNDHINLMNYCHPAIWALWEYDQSHDSELVETLFAFIQHSCNTARTAAILSLHKNTLLYRLNRIKEITGNDLASGEDLFLFHLSIRALIYLGFLEPRIKPRTSADLHCRK